MGQKAYFFYFKISNLTKHLIYSYWDLGRENRLQLYQLIMYNYSSTITWLRLNKGDNFSKWSVLTNTIFLLPAPWLTKASWTSNKSTVTDFPSKFFTIRSSRTVLNVVFSESRKLNDSMRLLTTEMNVLVMVTWEVQGVLK